MYDKINKSVYQQKSEFNLYFYFVVGNFVKNKNRVNF
jgi:hypothetical protein